MFQVGILKTILTPPPSLIMEFQSSYGKMDNSACQCLGAGRFPVKPSSSSDKYIWDKPRASGTLESIVNQATCLPIPKPNPPIITEDANYKDQFPWQNDTTARSATMAMDALVPCSNPTMQPAICSTRVASCSAATAPPEWSTSNSATFERDSQHLTPDTSDIVTSTSMDSTENTSSGKNCTKITTTDDNDSVYHTRPARMTSREEKKKGNEKSSISTKRSRAAAIHNQSERNRRDKINQKMNALQKLVPNSSKTDKASILEEVIEYLKQLQAQLQMLMLPTALQQQQQQLQMSMMGPMSMGMGIGMGNNIAGISPLVHPHPTAFMPMTAADRLQAAAAVAPMVMPDPFSDIFSIPVSEAYDIGRL